MKLRSRRGYTNPSTVRAVEASTHEPSQAEIKEYGVRLREARVEAAKAPVERYVDGKRVAWMPLKGSQTAFMSCPFVEVLNHGTRGAAKTDGMIMSYAQHVDKGHGHAWRGVIFRQTYPQLADVQAKTEKWFSQIFPQAKFNRSKMMWEWPTGEALLLRHMARPEDCENYQGHEYPFIGWEELTNWRDDECFRKMFACCRSSKQGVPRMIRATTNPYGVGHGWVQDRYKLHGDWWRTRTITDAVDDSGRKEPIRCAIHSHVDENTVLLEADPNYKDNLAAAATSPEQAKAWFDGDWDIPVGGMFSAVWKSEFNVMERFEVPIGWRVDRSFDWGSTKPFAVGWWARSDGSDLLMRDGSWRSTVPGDLFRVKEWYGCSGKPNQGVEMLATEISQGIIEREILWGWRRGDRCIVQPGPADSSIFTVESGHCIGSDMAKPVRFDGSIYRGISWAHADKRPGSRVQGWELMRKMMKAAHRIDGLPREAPGLFVVGSECPDFLRTVLSLPRDEKNLEDVDTDAEDHIADETRYRIRSEGFRVRSGTTSGMW